jgi:hypothetical protein
MFCRISRFSARLGPEWGEAAKVLSRLADHGVDLKGVTVGEAGPDGAEVALFTTDPGGLAKAARLESIALDTAPPREAENRTLVLALGPSDWLRCILVASSVLWLRELVKIVARHRERAARHRERAARR